VETEKNISLENLRLDDGTILIFIMRKEDVKEWTLVM